LADLNCYLRKAMFDVLPSSLAKHKQDHVGFYLKNLKEENFFFFL
jgi:hypothetical protein